MEGNILYWFTGLFEGEGTFNIHQNKARRICITSTDRDVLERIQSNIGGKIYTIDKLRRKPHWKQAYLWYISGRNAFDICCSIYPILLSRRKKRCKEYMECFMAAESGKVKIKQTFIKIIELRKQGLTHKQISELVGYERSHISKLLKIAREENMVLEALR